MKKHSYTVHFKKETTNQTERLVDVKANRLKLHGNKQLIQRKINKATVSDDDDVVDDDDD